MGYERRMTMSKLLTPRVFKAQSTCIVVVQAWLAITASASSLRLVSTVDPDFGPPSGGNGDSYLPTMSRDGRYVLFASTANNLATVGSNQPLRAVFPAPINVFLRDRTNGSTTLISINLAGTGGGDADSLPIGVSTNGRYALFESSASNLLAGDTNNANDVFVRDVLTGTTLLVSGATNGGFADNSSYSSVMTPDGRYVAFASAADNLVANDTNGIPDVFVRDLVSKVTTLVSVGGQSWGFPDSDVGSDDPLITPNGRYVAFYSTATNLVPGVQTVGNQYLPDRPANLYLRDRVTGNTTWVSADAVTELGLQSAAPVTNGISFNAALSDDGRFVAFEAIPYAKVAPAVILRYDADTAHTDLIETNAAVQTGGSFESIQDLAMTPDGRFVAYVAGALAGSSTTAIRVWDAQTGISTLASGNTNNMVVAGALSDYPVMDDSGRFVAFNSGAAGLVTNVIPGDFHFYLRDLAAGTTRLLDADTNGVGSPTDSSSTPTISADGRLVAFDCQDSRIVPADRNHSYDVFLRNVPNATSELISGHDPAFPSFTPDGISAISSSSVSLDARFIAFWSEADDVVGNDTNGVRDVFVRDALSGASVLVSVNTNGVAGDGYSTDPAISADGRYVAFTSLADDLVKGDTNRGLDIFLRDVPAGTTTLVSVNAAGTGPGNADSSSPVLSSDGRIVMFHSLGGNLSPGMVAGRDNLFWRDLGSGRTYALTTNQAADRVTAAAMTSDGGLVAFATGSSTFPALPHGLYVWGSGSASIVYSVAGNGTAFGPLAISPTGQKLAYVTNGATTSQLVAVDLVLKTNWIIASYSGHSTSPPRFSADSRFLAYVGSLGSTAYTNQVYLHDFQTGTNQLISQSSDGSGAGNDDSDTPDLSSDGRFVSYRSAASNLVAGDLNGAPDIFLYDGQSGGTTLITGSRFGNVSADNRSLMPVFSGDGRTLVFVSWASDLTADDFNNNADVFALGLYPGTAVPDFAVSVLPVPSPVPHNWLSWPANPGKSYRVQIKNQLSDSMWQELSGQVSVVGNQGYFNDGTPVTTRFYRIVAY